MAVTWLTVYIDEWFRVVGGKPTAGELASRMKRLETDHGREKVIANFLNYLARVDIQFASLKRFEETFRQWGDALASAGAVSANRAMAEQIKRRMSGAN